MRKISEQECLENLIGGIDCISQYHRHNKVWCCNQSNWNEKEYGWTNPLFPPEYQKACLNGTEFVPESTCDLYFFMIQFYIWVIGSNPDINFLRNDKWKKKFILYTENYEEQTQKLIMILFLWCTRSSVDKRPGSAMILKNTEYYQILSRRLEEYQGNEEKSPAEKWYKTLFE